MQDIASQCFEPKDMASLTHGSTSATNAVMESASPTVPVVLMSQSSHPELHNEDIPSQTYLAESSSEADSSDEAELGSDDSKSDPGDKDDEDYREDNGIMDHSARVSTSAKLTITTTAPVPRRTRKSTLAPVKGRKVDPTSKNQLKLKRRAAHQQIKVLEQKLAGREQEIAELETQKRESDKIVRELQAEALKQLSKGSVAALADNVVRSKIEALVAMCKGWAKKYCATSYWDQNEAQRQKLVGLVSWVSGDTKRPFVSPDTIFALKKGELSIRTATEAVLLRWVCNNSFTSPFYFLSQAGKTTGGQVPDNTRQVLQWLLNEGKSRTNQKVNVWRASTMRMIDPPADDKARSTTDAKKQESIDQLKEIAHHNFVNKFETKVSRYMCRDLTEMETEKRQKGLENIIRAARTLSSRLATQNVRVDVLFFHEFQKLKHEKYFSSSEFMTPHNSMHCEDDDHRIEGAGIDFVVYPAIVAYGTERGDFYSRYKVWHKAVVWMATEKAAGKPEPERPLEKQKQSAKRKSSEAAQVEETTTGSPQLPIILHDDEHQHPATPRVAPPKNAETTDSDLPTSHPKSISEGQPAKHSPSTTLDHVSSKTPPAPLSSDAADSVGSRTSSRHPTESTVDAIVPPKAIGEKVLLTKRKASVTDKEPDRAEHVAKKIKSAAEPSQGTRKKTAKKSQMRDVE